MKSTALSFLLILRTLTPLHAQSQVKDTTFSSDRGFYTSAFSLEITTKTDGATIYFTTDGRPPSPANGTIYDNPIQISSTTVVRAMATAPGMTPTNIDTQTYLFPADIINQSASITGYPRPNYSTGGGGPVVQMDYEMDPGITTNPAYSSDVLAAFAGIPSMCLSLDPNEIFGENHFYDGEDIEARVAVEILYPDDPSSNEKTEAGIESHSHQRLKRSMRLNFRSEYGHSRWSTGLFRKTPFNPNNRATPNEVKRVILRAGNNRAWSRTFSREKTTFALDEFARLSQQAMGGDGMRGAFVHLFINGIYWGLYNPVIRADTFYTSDTYGGADEDWFAVNHGGDLSGNDDRYDYLRGPLKNKDMSDSSNYQELTEHLDIDNFIDYLLIHWYTNTGDWPQNNWYGGLRNSSSPDGPAPMKFFAWDGEWSWDLPHGSIQSIAPDPDDTWVHPDFRADDLKNKNRTIPDLFNSAKDNPLFLRRLADRAYLHLSNTGALSDSASSERFASLTTYLENAVVAESARWGDALDDDNDGDPLFTRDIHWANEVANLLTYIDGRAPKLITALRNEGYYPGIDPPVLNQHGGEIAPGFQLSLSAPSPGVTVFYTLDGSDPVENGIPYTSAIPLSGSTRVLARSHDGIEWSAAADATFLLPYELPLLVSEIHYHPSLTLENHTDANDLEYLELYNPGSEPINLSGYQFSSGIFLTLPDNTLLPPGETAVVAGDTLCFRQQYGPGATILGDYSGKLSNDGERITLISPLGQKVIDFTYNDVWHPRSDGQGYSLQLADIGVTGANQADWSTPIAWIDSGLPDGTPGALPPTNLPFDTWQEKHLLPPGEGQRDSDRDGYSDLIEYAFGTHPLHPDRAALNINTAGAFFSLRQDRSEVTVTPQLSSTLNPLDWSDSDTTVDNLTPGFENHTLIWPNSSQQFLRLKAERP